MRKHSAESGESRRRRRRRLLALLLGSAAIVWFLPSILGTQYARRQILRAFDPELANQIELGQISLSWMRPLKASDITVRDEAGQPAIVISEIRTDRKLWQLVWDHRRIGRIVADRPAITATVGADGSCNIVKLVHQFAQPSHVDTRTQYTFLLLINDASFSITDSLTGGSLDVESLEASVECSEAAGPSIRTELVATVHEADESGRLTARMDLSTHADRAGHLKLSTRDFDLNAFEPLLRYFIGQSGLRGQLDSDIDIAWDGWSTEPTLSVRGKAKLSQLAVKAEKYLASDVLTSSFVESEIDLSLDNDILNISKLDLDSELGNVSATGVVPLARLAKFGSNNQLDGSKIAASGLRIVAELDVARIANSIPNALRLRSGTQLTTGRVNLTLTEQPTKEGLVWASTIQATNIGGTHNGKRLHWRDPLDLSIQIRSGDRDFLLDAFEARTSFGQMSGRDIRGAGELGELAGWINLNQLTKEVGEFVDLQGAELEGQCQFAIQGQRRPDRTVRLKSELQIVKFKLARGGRATWAVDEFSGHVDSHWTALIGKERVELRDLHCDLSHVRLRARGITVDEPQIQIRGDAVWDLRKRNLNSESFTFASTSLAFRADKFSVGLSKKSTSGIIGFRGDLDRIWKRNRLRTLTSGVHPKGQCVGQIELTSDSETIGLQGEVDIKSLELWKYHDASSQKPAYQNARDNRWIQLWNENQVAIALRGELDIAKGDLVLSQCDITSKDLAVSCAGNISSMLGPAELDVEGVASCELRSVIAKLQHLVGPSISFRGKRRVPFRIQGPLRVREKTDSGPFISAVAETPIKDTAAQKPVIARLEGNAKFGWDSGIVYGIPVGPADLSVHLGQGVLHTEPLRLRVSNGWLAATPRLDFRSTPTKLMLGNDTSIGDVHLTTAICNRWIKYIAPLLANVTEAQGRFSLTLDKAQLPLDNISLGQAHGNLKIHSAQVLPGSLARQLLTIVNDVNLVFGRQPLDARLTGQKGAWVEIVEQDIPFAMSNGWIEHRGAEMVIGDVTIRTRGSVGMNQSLDILAEIPIRDEWIANRAYLAGLRGESIRIPIAGSFQQPRIDRRALRQLTRRTLENSAARLIQEELPNRLQNELDKHLKKLFSPD